MLRVHTLPHPNSLLPYSGVSAVHPRGWFSVVFVAFRSKPLRSARKKRDASVLLCAQRRSIMAHKPLPPHTLPVSSRRRHACCSFCLGPNASGASRACQAGCQAAATTSKSPIRSRATCSGWARATSPRIRRTTCRSSRHRLIPCTLAPMHGRHAVLHKCISYPCTSTGALAPQADGLGGRLAKVDRVRVQERVAGPG